MLFVIQIEALGVIVNDGATVLDATVTETVLDKQPPVVPLNVNVPALFTIGLAVFDPETIPVPIQVYVVTPEPFNVNVGLVHVIVCDDPAFAVGGVLTVTNTLPVVLQPDAVLVTTTE